MNNTKEAKETVEVAKDSIESLADNIKIISEAARIMLDSGLKQETIVLLLHDHSKVKKSSIKDVLRSLTCLDYYLED